MSKHDAGPERPLQHPLPIDDRHDHAREHAPDGGGGDEFHGLERLDRDELDDEVGDG
jgi:hypothetical protein